MWETLGWVVALGMLAGTLLVSLRLSRNLAWITHDLIGIKNELSSQLEGPDEFNFHIATVRREGLPPKNHPRILIINNGQGGAYPLPGNLYVKDLTRDGGVGLEFVEDHLYRYTVRHLEEFDMIYQTVIESLVSRDRLEWGGEVHPLDVYRRYNSPSELDEYLPLP